MLTLKQKVLCFLIILFTGTGLVAQNGFRDEFINPPDEVLITNSLEELLGFENLKVWSTSGVINLSFSSQSTGETVIQIFDIAGREIINEKVQKTESEFNFQHDSSSLPKSIYIVRLGLGKNKIAKKVYL